jgi:hypothetical protein
MDFGFCSGEMQLKAKKTNCNSSHSNKPENSVSSMRVSETYAEENRS